MTDLEFVIVKRIEVLEDYVQRLKLLRPPPQRDPCATELHTLVELENNLRNAEYAKDAYGKRIDALLAEREQLRTLVMDADQWIAKLGRQFENFEREIGEQKIQLATALRCLRLCVHHLRKDSTKQDFLDACKLLGIDPVNGNEPP